MDDLISRKALDDAFTELRWNEDGTLNHFGDRPDWCMHGSEVDKLIQNAPSVPAVPLDKLCEWLEKHACYDQAEDNGGRTRFSLDAGQWESVLTEWMEGSDAD